MLSKGPRVRFFVDCFDLFGGGSIYPRCFHPFLNVENLTDNAEILSEKKVLKIEK